MPAALVRDRSPYPLPPLGTPVRVAFLGAAATSAAHALHAPAGGIEPRFFDVRAGADPRAVRSALADAAPHVVVALAPELVPDGAFDGLRAATLAVTAPGRLQSATRSEGFPDGRLQSATRSEGFPDGTAAAGYDRVLQTPGGADGAWRSRPLPVDDRLYGAVRPSRRPPRALFVGRSTEHRESILTMSKHTHDVVHYTHGLVGEAFAEVLASADVGIALTADAGQGFPAQTLVHLAAGHLLLASPLAPACGLEPGIDFLEIDSRESLDTILIQLRLGPDAYERVRVRGRLKAEEHRASRVWPRIVHDLLGDIDVFGPGRAGALNTLKA